MKQVGDFILEEPLKLGRWTEVWRARWLKAPAPHYELVALKILRIEFSLDPKLIQRFNNEIQTTSKLQHSNVAAPMAWGLFNDGRRYFATQFIHGQRLSNWMNGSPLPTNFTLSVLHQIADGLDYIHRNDVVHRDIKPDNILIAGQGKPYLVDFSIALSREVVRVTGVGELVGTVAYMAPEIILGNPISSVTDIYSLGVLAFQMLTGRLPFEGKPLDVTYKHVNIQPPQASTINAKLSPAVDQCLAWALAKEPNQRPRLASQFVKSLQVAIKTDKWETFEQTPPSNWFTVLLGFFIAVLIIVILLAVIMWRGQ